MARTGGNREQTTVHMAIGGDATYNGYMVALTNPPTLVPEKRPPVENGGRFRVVSDFQPAGDQPRAIAALTQGIESGERDQVLLGVTGSGKTFTVAKVIENLQRPALILAPNKTLAAQLYGEMKAFFQTMPSNTSCHTMITISRKPMCRGAIRT